MRILLVAFAIVSVGCLDEADPGSVDIATTGADADNDADTNNDTAPPDPLEPTCLDPLTIDGCGTGIDRETCPEAQWLFDTRAARAQSGVREDAPGPCQTFSSRTYDDRIIATTFTYDEAGRLTVRDEDYWNDCELDDRLRQKWDSEGRLIETVNSNPSTGNVVARKVFTYDAQGLLIGEASVNDNFGHYEGTVEYDYDADGNRIRLTRTDSNGVFVGEYLPCGAPLSFTRNGVVTATFESDAECRTTAKLKVAEDGTPTGGEYWSYDDAGNRVSHAHDYDLDGQIDYEERWVWNAQNDTVRYETWSQGELREADVWQRQYDADDRLVHSVRAPELGDNNTMTETWTYRPNGKLEQDTVDDVKADGTYTITTRHYSPEGHLLVEDIESKRKSGHGAGERSFDQTVHDYRCW